MSDLGFNKIAAAVLMTGLLAIGLNEVSHQFFHHEKHEAEGYAIEVANAPSADGGAVEPEGPRDYYTFLMSADPAAGETVAAKCLQCHLFEKGAASLQGPPLWGVVGRDIASHPGFGYATNSDGLTSLEGVWDYEHLDKFLERPKAYAPGTSMNFIGIRKEKDRADLIAYLRTLADPGSEMPLPEPLPVQSAEAAPVEGAPTEGEGSAGEAPAGEAPASGETPVQPTSETPPAEAPATAQPTSAPLNP
ncbi:c-type cytochrome [bacterium]|nr:c-type cytochrome [bacterium]